MKPQNKPANVQSDRASGVANATPAARRAWAVNFSVPAPQSMPSDRLAARAELVRKALGCGGIY